MISTLTSLLSRGQHENASAAHEEGTDADTSPDPGTAGPDVSLLADAEELIAGEDGEDATESNPNSGTPIAATSAGQLETVAADHRETEWEFVAGAVDRALEREGPVAISESPDQPSEPESTDGREDDAANDRSVETGESVAAVLVSEIEAGRVDDADIEALQEALGVEPRASVDVRLERLQTQVADLEAYAASFERFLDESGTPGQVVSDLRTRIDGATDRLDDEVAHLEGRVDEQAAAHAADVERLERRVEGVATALTDSVVALSRDVESLREDVQAGAEWRTSVREAMGSPPAESARRAD